MDVSSAICKDVPCSLLEKTVPISLLDEVAHALVDWEELGPYLDLTSAEQNEIRQNFPGQYLLQKREALRKWRKIQLETERSATLQRFISILCEHGQVSLAEIVAKKCTKLPAPILSHAKYLQRYYLEDFIHPANKQWPTILGDIDFPPVYVDLKLHVAPISNKDVQGTFQKHTEIQLADAFQKTPRRFVILFEGIAGSGKTTLSWHACREWANGRLLNQFNLLIHIELNDSKFQRAEMLQDIIPDPNKEARDEIAQAITDQEGRGICLILDGLDEASKELHDFILTKLLCNKQLSHLSVILTSRPDSTMFIHLQKLLTLKIVISGFSPETLSKFMKFTIDDDTDTQNKVDKMFKLNPKFQALCTLPINAVITSYLVQQYGEQPPSTQTGLFKLLVSHICSRHMQLRIGTTDLEIEHLPSDVPSELRESFDKLCLLAYTAAMENKRKLLAGDLRKANFDERIDNKLGILQIYQKKTMHGVQKNCSFPHLSLQQFLAALHLSCQNNEKQSSSVTEIMQRDPLDEMLPFYAGLTKLNCEESRKALYKVFELCLNETGVTEALKRNLSVSSDPRRQALCLLRCLYECQEESLMEKAQIQIELRCNNPGINFRYTISFHGMWLSPLECLAVAYFVRFKSISMHRGALLNIGLDLCYISETSVKVLTTELRRGINYYTPGRVMLRLADNRFNYSQLMSVKELLKGQSNIEGVGLQRCFKSMDMKVVLKHIIEGLNSNSSCSNIAIGYGRLNKSHIHHVLLLITSCTQLRIINLNRCRFSTAFPLLSKALSLLNLFALELNECDIDDEALEILAVYLSHKQTIKLLHLFRNEQITPQGFVNFLHYLTNPL